MRIEIKILNKEFYRDEEYCLPKYTTSGSAAVDLICTKDIILYPGETAAIHTGLAVWIGSHNDVWKRPGDQEWTQNHYVGLIVPRSGLGTKGLVLANTIGVIDEDYQGELIVQAWNRNTTFDEYQVNCNDATPCGHIVLRPRERFAQLLFFPSIKADWQIVDEFTNKTRRGENGFGSTGV